MHFNGAAARWLQSVESEISSCSWSAFSTMIMEHFGRDHHELLIRRLFHIRQTDGVVDYIDRFAGLVDQLTAYGSATDPKYFTQRFIDGLNPTIRSAVMLQRPSTWDTPCDLA